MRAILLIVAAMVACPPQCMAGEGGPHVTYHDRFVAAGYIGNTGGEGLGLYLVATGSVHGLLLAFKGNLGGYEGDTYYERLSYHKVAQWGDKMIDESIAIRTAEIAYGYRLTQWLFTYAGFGSTTYTCFREHLDPSYILGIHGRYWISYSPKNHREFGVVCGGLFFLDRSLHLVIGYQSEPAGANFGLGWAWGV
ncbi:MAG: hypothetical protein KAY24_17630 [Candidatus Eisenbacteria sp.]|nr:hypothetical protein [Candidatus Eisenbacteria bacterium]